MNRSESLDNSCSVCHDVIEIYAIGPCDHPVCFRCSTRMRVLCETADCPICRSLMPQVAFVHQRSLFKDINLRDCIPNRKNKIFYEDEDTEDRYLNLLEFRCRVCPNRKSDRTFGLLQTHMRREHQLFACDLCLSHLKIFPYERKFYDRKNLATHRRLGDPDDKSYKGHPLCEFCDVRYNDKDDLMKHLRKDHYFCHFCDQQGSNAYYNEYSDLKQHFADSHFLCTEDVCGDPHTQFTHAFSSEIDLKAHKTKMHNKNMTKFQSREARHIEVDFQLHPRRQGYGGRGASNTADHEDSHRGGRGGERYNHRRQQKEDSQLARALAESIETATAANAPPPVQERLPDPVHDFPTLNGAPAALAQPLQSVPQKPSPVEDFPTLSVAHSQAGISQSHANTKAYASAMNFQMDTKPSKKEKSESKPVNIGSVSSITKERWVSSHAPRVTEENFPTLSGKNASSSSNSNSGLSNWSKTPSNRSNIDNQVSVIPNKTFTEEKPKNVKHKVAKQLDKSIGDENEFPSLDGSGRDSGLRNNTLWQRPKSAPKNTSQSRSQKVDDDNFELPESYFKAYEPNELQQKVGVEEKISNSNMKNSGAAAPIINKSKDFPSLPVRDLKASDSSDKKKKAKPKEKKLEPKVEKTSSVKPKKSKGGSSSLNDIAKGLVVNGDSSTQSVKDRTDKRSTQSQSSRSKPDWFDNPGGGCQPEEPVSSKKQNSCDEDTSTEPAPAVDNSFPSLHAMSTPIQDTRAPPGFSPNPLQMLGSSAVSAPPGYSKLLAAPPGFSSVKTSALYIQPADFTARNQQLIKKIHNCLSTVEDGFHGFKTFSGQYRQGLIEGVEYYLKCQKLMGEEDFSMVFPELVALLPDVGKQQELWAINQTANSNKPDKSRDRNQTQSQLLWQQVHAMSPCPKCGQIVLSKDDQFHKLQHGEQNDFPALGGAAKKSKGGKEMKEPNNPVKGAWIKAK